MEAVLASSISRQLRLFLVQIAFVCVATLSVFAADPVAPFNGPRFSTDPRALYSSASETIPPEGTDVTVLDDEESYVFDGNGHSVRNQYMVFKVLTQEGPTNGRTCP